jgi:hypothetical protein
MQTFEEYKKIAKHNGFEYYDKYNGRNLIIPSDRILNSKVCCMRDNDFVFFASDSYAAKAYVSSTFSGVYGTLPIQTDYFKAMITKHFWFDFLAFEKRVTTGDSYLDKNLRITTNNVELILRVLNVRVVDMYLNMWNKYSSVKIVMGSNYLPEVDALKDKLVVGVELKEWIIPERFDETYKDFKKLIVTMSNMLSKDWK